MRQHITSSHFSHYSIHPSGIPTGQFIGKTFKLLIMFSTCTDNITTFHSSAIPKGQPVNRTSM